VRGNRFTDCMKLRLLVGLFLAGFIACGCAHHRAPTPESTPAPTPVSTNPEPIVTPDNSLSAKVVRYNSVGRFVVLSFPVGQMPQNGQTFFLYRAGMKIGQVKITGPQRDNDTVADLIEGDAQQGDDVREQ
jgi:hypothetical protein